MSREKRGNTGQSSPGRRPKASPEELERRAAARGVRRLELKAIVVEEAKRRGGKCEAPGCDVEYVVGANTVKGPGRQTLHWHHRNPDDRVALISSMAANAKTTDDILRAELRKCALLCQRHHAWVEADHRARRERKANSLAKGLDPDDAEKLIRAPNIYYANGFRSRLVMEMMLRCGMRVSEVCNLKLQHLRREDWRIEIRESKTGDRFIYLPTSMEAEMQLWLRRRREEFPSSPYLFPTRNGGRMSRSTVAAMMDRMAERAGIEPTHPHALRHTFATEYIRRGGDVATLQEILGHQHATMSIRYAKANPERVRRAMRAM